MKEISRIETADIREIRSRERLTKNNDFRIQKIKHVEKINIRKNYTEFFWSSMLVNSSNRKQLLNTFLKKLLSAKELVSYDHPVALLCKTQ